MTKNEFLMMLEAHLYPLTKEERESALAYYKEYLEEAGDNASSAMEALGSPQSVAQKIIAEASASPYDTDRGTSGYRGTTSGYTPPRYTAPQYTAPQYTSPQFTVPPPPYPKNNRTTGGRIALTITAVLVTFPFWFTVLCVWASLIFTMWVTLLAFAVAAVAAPIQGTLFIHDGLIGSGLWEIGGGILCLGLVLLLWYPFLKGTVSSTKALFRLTKNILRSLLEKENAV